MLDKLVNILMKKGLPMLAGSVVDMGVDQAFDFVKDKTGIDLHRDGAGLDKLNNPEVVKKLTALDVEMAKVKAEERSAELNSEIRHAELELETFEKEETTRQNARSMEKEYLKSDDWITRNWLHIFAFYGSAMIFWFIYMIIFTDMPSANQKYADIILGMFVSTLGGIFAYHFGTTKNSGKKDETLAKALKDKKDYDDLNLF